MQRGDILPTLVEVADEDDTTEARFKCVAALTLLAESLANAIPLLESGALAPLMDILHEAGPDPTQWKGQTASWCVGFLMNIAQSDEAVPGLREAGVVELLAPLLTLDHYQSLKAAMAITFVCRYDEGDETYDLLRKTENVIPKIQSARELGIRALDTTPAAISRGAATRLSINLGVASDAVDTSTTLVE